MLDSMMVLLLAKEVQVQNLTAPPFFPTAGYNNYTKFTIDFNSVMNANKIRLQKDNTLYTVNNDETEESGTPIIIN